MCIARAAGPQVPFECSVPLTSRHVALIAPRDLDPLRSAEDLSFLAKRGADGIGASLGLVLRTKLPTDMTGHLRQLRLANCLSLVNPSRSPQICGRSLCNPQATPAARAKAAGRGAAACGQAGARALVAGHRTSRAALRPAHSPAACSACAAYSCFYRPRYAPPQRLTPSTHRAHSPAADVSTTLPPPSLSTLRPPQERRRRVREPRPGPRGALAAAQRAAERGPAGGVGRVVDQPSRAQERGAARRRRRSSGPARGRERGQRRQRRRRRRRRGHARQGDSPEPRPGNPAQRRRLRHRANRRVLSKFPGKQLRRRRRRDPAADEPQRRLGAEPGAKQRGAAAEAAAAAFPRRRRRRRV